MTRGRTGTKRNQIRGRRAKVVKHSQCESGRLWRFQAKQVLGLDPDMGAGELRGHALSADGSISGAVATAECVRHHCSTVDDDGAAAAQPAGWRRPRTRSAVVASDPPDESAAGPAEPVKFRHISIHPIGRSQRIASVRALRPPYGENLKDKQHD
jgi:hypothetical protein